jgi:fructose-1,6-bisphosphatase/inositol monophosphatase family enzyme
VTLEHPLLEPIRSLHREIRAGVLAACREQSLAALARVADDGEGDTLYAVDKVSEALLVERLARDADRLGGIVLIAEGIAGGVLTLPEGRDERRCRYRVIVDPIDGTRSLMYQKRPAWILTGVAENRGPETRLSDVELAVQTELPLVKQHLADELWAVRGQGACAARADLLANRAEELRLAPSRATGIEHGYAMISRLFPGARDELAALDEEIVEALIGKPAPRKARCFEDQYPSTGGQLYELMAGHDRFIADLRPRLTPLLAARGLPPPLCCHPYDIATALIAEELGVCVRTPEGGPLDCRLDIDEDVAWVGYANPALREAIEPVLVRALARRGWLLGAEPGTPP